MVAVVDVEKIAAWFVGVFWGFSWFSLFDVLCSCIYLDHYVYVQYLKHRECEYDLKTCTYFYKVSFTTCPVL